MNPAHEKSRWLLKLKPWLWLAAAAGVIVVLSNLPVRDRMAGAVDWLRTQGIWAPVFFCVVYFAATVFLIPGSLLTLAGGWIFGFWQGVLMVTIAANSAAASTFVISRHWLRAPVERMLAKRPVVAAIDRAVTQDGWKMVALLRLSPAFPFNLLNYALGLTGVTMRGAVIGTLIGMVPGTLMYVYLGRMSGEAVFGTGAAPPKSPGEWALQAAGLLVTILITVRITLRAKAALRERLADGPALTPPRCDKTGGRKSPER